MQAQVEEPSHLPIPVSAPHPPLYEPFRLHGR